jgi:hypothetical protein
MAAALPGLERTGHLGVVRLGAGGAAPELVQGVAGQARLVAIAIELEQAPDRRVATIERRLLALDRLSAELVELSSGLAGAIWLAVDGWPLDLAALGELEDGGLEPEPGGFSPAAVVRRTARLAAGYGWTLFPLAARPEVDPTQLRRETRDPAREKFVPEDPLRPTFYWFRWRYPKKKRVPIRSAAMALELATDLRFQPFDALAAPTAGALVGDAFAVVDRAQRLAGRRALVVREPEAPPGTLQRLEVLWLGDGRPLRAPGWVRTGTPPETAAARLSAIAAGGLDPRRGWPLALDAGTETVCLKDVRAVEWLRISVRRGDGVVRLGESFEVGKGALPCARFDPATAAGDWVLLEEVDGGAWGALRL